MLTLMASAPVKYQNVVHGTLNSHRQSEKKVEQDANQAWRCVDALIRGHKKDAVKLKANEHPKKDENKRFELAPTTTTRAPEPRTYKGKKKSSEPSFREI